MKHYTESFYDEDYFKPHEVSEKSSFTMPYTWEVEEKNAVQVASRLIGLFNPGSICDIGCGKGFLLKAFKQQGVKQVAGIDISKWVVDNADSMVQQYLSYGDIRDGLPYKKDEFDMVVSFSTLEHIEEEYIPDLLWNMKNISKSLVYLSLPVNLHDYNNEYFGDKSHMTIKTPGWWISQAHNVGLNYDPRHSNMTCDDPMYNMNFLFIKQWLERWMIIAPGDEPGWKLKTGFSEVE